MAKSKHIWLGMMICIFFCISFINAEEKIYIDKEEAAGEVKKLNDEIAVLQGESSKLEAENASLNNQIAGWQAVINDQILPLQKSVSQKIADLRALSTTIVDETMKNQAIDSLSRGLESIRKLEVKRQMFETSIFQANVTITENKNKINRNTQKIERNNQTITMLNQSVKNTNEQNVVLQEYINTVDDFLADSEALIGDVKLIGIE